MAPDAPLIPCPDGLAADADKRALKTLARVKQAIAALKRQSKRPTMRNLAAATAEPNKGLRPLAESTIQGNTKAYAEYVKAHDEYARAHGLPVRRTLRRPRRRDKHLERKTKAELIDIVHDLKSEVAQLECIARNLAFGDREGRGGDGDGSGGEDAA